MCYNTIDNMKKISKFKQLSKDIKLIIITTLIMSCFGVYAAGTCIINATADDVNYNNTTVKAAIDELYTMAQSYCPPGYECRQLKYVTDCSNNKVYTTTPSNLSGLAKIMAYNAYLDNGKSAYVSSCNGIDFNDMASNTNGIGIYEIASTKNNSYPIYYYRGTVYNNNVKFAGFCWKAVLTTDTGGVKLIYTGTPDQNGYCPTSMNTSTPIGTSRFNTSYTSVADVGYMYGTRYTRSTKSTSNLATAYIYGNDVTYSGGTYTLQNTMTSTGTWATDYTTLNNNHYTCFSTGNTCTSVYYIYFTSASEGARYITLSNGKKVEDALDDMFINTNNSVAKTTIDTWYNTNLSSYTNYIEDTVYCSDRSISNLGGWDPDGGDTTKSLKFSAYTRNDNNNPNLICNRMLDRFTVSSSIGNGALTYPVGLLTIDETMYAGNIKGTWYIYYLHSEDEYWLATPSDYINIYAAVFTDAGADFTNESYGLYPVISLKSTDIVESGDGAYNNPYIIKTS